MTEVLLRSDDGRGVTTLTLNRPEKHNALDSALITALAEAAAAIAADDSVRVVVLTGAGESFCAGGDLAWMKAQAAATRAERIAEATRLASMLGTLDRLPRPLIARVQGQAYGGGLGLMSVSDTVIAARPGRFAFTETRLGLTPATIAPYVIRRMEIAKAREVFGCTKAFDAEEAVRLGLVTRAVEGTDLDAAVEAEVAPYLTAAPGAVRASKALLHALSPGPDEATVAMTIEALAERWETAEAQEGIAAFFERRRPRW
ncbi:MAG: crotonase/enoyl-CoA hydratase family protein [Pseudomonadota bacterium]